MHARTLLLGLAWLALVPCRAQEAPVPTPPPAAFQGRLDGGLLEPGWFGPGPVWSRDKQVDYFWAKLGVRLDPPALYLRPWEEPKFLSERDALDYASGWEAAEYLQNLLRARLAGMAGLRLATSPDQTPYHASGRIVEATHIRQGAGATFGLAAGLPTFTWDFKVMDLRSGEIILASHHRSVWAPASNWISAVESPIRSMVGLPPRSSWEKPPETQTLEDRSWTWSEPGLRLPPGSVKVGAWSSDTDSGAFKGWSNGAGASLAARTEGYVRDRLTHTTLLQTGEAKPGYTLHVGVFVSLKFLHPRYRAMLEEAENGRVVAQCEFLPSFGLFDAPLKVVAERMVTYLETLQKGTTPAPGPSVVAASPLPGQDAPGSAEPLPASAALGKDAAGRQPEVTQQPISPKEGTTSAAEFSPKALADQGGATPAPAWEGLERLVPVSGEVDKAWVSPGLRLAGRTLLVADWSEPALKPEADGHDQQIARAISLRAPAWLYGALAAHPERGFRIHRQEGDLRLEGRIVHLYQPDRSKFWTFVGQAYTFGLSTKADGILQLRVVDAQTGATLALVEHRLASYQVASDGVPYKAFKWLAQGLVEWLLQEGRREPAKAASPGESQGSPAPSKEAQAQTAPAD